MQLIAILTSVLLGGLFATLLYFKDKKSSLDLKIRLIGAILRFTLIALIVWLIISPAISFIKHSEVKPSLIVALDQSQSMISHADSNLVKSEIIERIAELEKNLSDDYDLHILNFSDKVNQGLSTDFSGKQTNLSAVLDYARVLSTNTSNSNLLLVTDGIYNKGSDPRFELSGSNLKIYTMAYGDTTLFADAKIESINTNKFAQLNIATPIEFSVSFNSLKGEKGNIWIEANSKKIFDQPIEVSKSSSINQFSINFTPDKKGIIRIKICVSTFRNEKNTINNCHEVYIEVTESKPKVLIAGLVPHPDLGAIRQAISEQEQFSMQTKLPPFTEDDLNDVSILVAHQLPGINKEGDNLITLALQKRIPIFLIIGQATNLNRLNELGLGVSISNNGSFIEAFPYVAPNFDLFHTEQTWTSHFASLPPLSVPSGDYKLSGELKPFLLQKINNIETNRPLIVLGQHDGIRLGILFGEGFWQQRIYGFSADDKHARVDEWFIKALQFINLREPQGRLKVIQPENIDRFTPLVLKAILKNKSGELTNEPEVKLELNSDSIPKPINYIFGKESSSYILDAGRLKPGKWNWKAFTKEGGEDVTSSGTIIINDFNAELMQTQANHALLRSLAHQQNGYSFKRNDWNGLFKALQERKNTMRQIVSERETEEPIRFIWVFILIILLMSTEWFIRKYNGAI